MTRIMIGTPAYGGQITTSYFHAALASEARARELGWTLRFVTRSNESLISRARNSIVAEFLGAPEFDWLLFVDADIGFTFRNVERLVAFGKPVCGAVCPMKNIDWDAAFEARGRAASAAELKAAGHRHAVNFEDEDYVRPDKTAPVRIENGFARVAKVGTGFMIVHRTAFDALRAAYPGLNYKNDIKGYANARTEGNFWAFFDAMLHPKTRRYLSEDYGFCHRWTAIGGEVWCDLDAELTHFGSYAFKSGFFASGTARG